MFVAAGDLNGDGKADLVITPDEGRRPAGPHFRAATAFAQLADFFGIDDPNFRGGARAAVGDVNDDGKADLVVAAGFGGGPRVAVFNGIHTRPTGAPETLRRLLRVRSRPSATASSSRPATWTATASPTSSPAADPAADRGCSPFPGKDLFQGNQVQLANFFAGDVNSRGGIRVAARDLDGDSKADLITGSGDGTTGIVNVYNAAQLLSQTNPVPFLTQTPFANSNGVFVG